MVRARRGVRGPIKGAGIDGKAAVQAEETRTQVLLHRLGRHGGGGEGKALDQWAHRRRCCLSLRHRTPVVQLDTLHVCRLHQGLLREDAVLN